MGSAIREFFSMVLRFSGMHWIMREILCRRKVAIVLYHNPTPEVMEQHMRYLAKHHHFITMKRLVDTLRTGEDQSVRQTPGTARLCQPRNRFVVTSNVSKRHFFAISYLKRLSKLFCFLCSAILFFSLKASPVHQNANFFRHFGSKFLSKNFLGFTNVGAPAQVR